MEINIKINLDNAAFVDENDGGFFNAAELKRILNKVASCYEGTYHGDLEADGDAGNCFDCNGNKVGGWEITN